MANTLNLFRNGAVGFIDWLGDLQKFALARRFPVAIDFVGASEQIRLARPIPLNLLAKPLKPLPALL